MKGQIANSFILAGYSTLLIKSKSSHRQSEMNEHVKNNVDGFINPNIGALNIKIKVLKL